MGMNERISLRIMCLHDSIEANGDAYTDVTEYYSIMYVYDGI